MEHLLRERAQDGPHTLDDVGGPTDHREERARDRAHLAAADTGVDHRDADGRGLRGERMNGLGRHGGVHADDRARFQGS